MERERKGQNFSEAELTKGLYQMVNANKYLQNKDRFNGDIRPLHIALHKKKSLFGLIDRHEIVDKKAIVQTQKNHMSFGNSLYQSPLMFENLKKGKKNFPFNANKEDMFATGLSLIEAGNQKSVQNIYDHDKKQMNIEKLNEHVGSFMQKY